MNQRPEATPVRGGSLSDMANELRPAADSGDDCLVHAASVCDALMEADAEMERLREMVRRLSSGPVGRNYASSSRRPPQPFENYAG